MRPGTVARRSGHTLIELIVAGVVFAIGVLALQGALVVVLRQDRDARIQTLAVEFASAQLERLANTSCSGTENGSTALRGVRLDWTTGGALGSHARLVTQTARHWRSTGARTDTFLTAVRCR